MSSCILDTSVLQTFLRAPKHSTKPGQVHNQKYRGHLPLDLVTPGADPKKSHQFTNPHDCFLQTRRDYHKVGQSTTHGSHAFEICLSWLLAGSLEDFVINISLEKKQCTAPNTQFYSMLNSSRNKKSYSRILSNVVGICVYIFFSHFGLLFPDDGNYISTVLTALKMYHLRQHANWHDYL